MPSEEVSEVECTGVWWLLERGRNKRRGLRGEFPWWESGKRYSVGRGGEGIRKPGGEKDGLQWPWREWTWCTKSYPSEER